MEVDHDDVDLPAPPAPATLAGLSRLQSENRPVSFRLPNGRIQSVRIGRGVVADPHRKLPTHPSMKLMKVKTSTGVPATKKKESIKIMEASKEGENSLLTHSGEIELREF